MSDTPLLSSRSRTPVAPAPAPASSGLMLLVSGVVVVAALSVAKSVLMPITLAVLLSFVLAPLVDLLRRAWLGRVPAVLLAVLLALGVILGLGAVIGAQVAELVGDVPRYASTVQEKLQVVQSATLGRVSALADRLAHQADRARQSAKAASAATAPDGHPAAPAPMQVEVHQPDPTAMERAEMVLTPALSPLATTGIVLVVAIFILLQQEDLRDRLIRLFGARDLHRTMTAMDDAARRLSRYFLTLLGMNTIFGAIIGSGLMLIGVPSPVLWGIVAALMRFVPYVGTMLSAGLALAMAAAVDPGWTMLVWTGALFTVAELVMGQFLEPLVYGRSTGLSPVSVVIAAIFWGWLWGPVGLILSMPLTLCLVVLGRYVDRLEFLDVLLGDQPALTPVESFYRRLLAGNLDEVTDGAEQMLKHHPLAAFYDEVAVPGLQLAATDAERGVLTADQLLRVSEGVDNLLDELSDHVDRDPEADAPVEEELPEAWRAPSAVLCVAGRGPLDGCAAAMLAQLLGKHGIGARVMPHAVVASRPALAALELDGVRTVCLTYLGIGGTPAHLRYTVRRLRTRLPNVTVMVWLWPEDIEDSERLRSAVAADGYAASMREMVGACIEQASKQDEGRCPSTPPKARPLETALRE